MATLVGIIAAVRMRPPLERQRLREHLEQHRERFGGPSERLEAFLDRTAEDERVELLVALSARAASGRQIDADGSLGLSGYQSLREVEAGIDQMLGRDPRLHRPPKLAWGQLITALAREGVEASEQELIALPITVELDREVAAKLESAR